MLHLSDSYYSHQFFKTTQPRNRNCQKQTVISIFIEFQKTIPFKQIFYDKEWNFLNLLNIFATNDCSKTVCASSGESLSQAAKA